MEVIAKIPLALEGSFLTVDTTLNKLYVSNHRSNSIQIIDCSSLKEIKKISIERPRQIAVNPSENSIFVIYGKHFFWFTDKGAKISKIDCSNYEITNSIGEKEGFGDIVVNPETGKVYATKHKAKQVWVIDGRTMKLLEKIQTKSRNRLIASDWPNNRIFLAGKLGLSEKLSVSQIDCSNHEVTLLAKKYAFGDYYPRELYYSPHFNFLYCLFEGSRPGSEVRETDIRQINLNDDSFQNSSKRMTSANGIGFDEKNDRIYFADPSKGEIQVLDHTLRQIGLFRYRERKLINGTTKVCVNPRSNHVYIADNTDGHLYVMSYP